ncbi:TPA: YtxH domain-containing protein [Candidatus Saccharibacteria bacterium]|nr:YtxH domain-containing protein [Candidatus Saccharibacteria bacterium]HIO87444.1 YtxH domain-containing protein [Candidatus Saccharibacteria bacterium]
MSKETKKAGLFGAIFGAIAGVVAGVFALAPKSAKENRDDVKKKAEELKKDVQTNLENIEKDLTAQFEKVEAEYKKARGKSREEWTEWKKKAEDMIATVEKTIKGDDEKEADSLADKAKSFMKEVEEKLSEKKK